MHVHTHIYTHMYLFNVGAENTIQNLKSPVLPVCLTDSWWAIILP